MGSIEICAARWPCWLDLLTSFLGIVYPISISGHSFSWNGLMVSNCDADKLFVEMTDRVGSFRHDSDLVRMYRHFLIPVRTLVLRSCSYSICFIRARLSKSSGIDPNNSSLKV